MSLYDAWKAEQNPRQMFGVGGGKPNKVQKNPQR